MRFTRREFIQTAALIAAGAAILPKSLLAGQKSNTITGVQLYSVRDEMKADPLGTLKKLAEMGYRHVEHANYVDRKFYGYSPKEFKKILNDLGMKMPSGHTVLNRRHWDDTKKDFTDLWKYTVEDAAVLEQQFVISPSLEESWRKDSNTL